MKRSQLEYINRKMRTFDLQVRAMIKNIDRLKKRSDADDDTMNKHYVGTNENGERIWSF